jgi:diguanylate cyclase (GGDEF)-like protein
MPRLAQHPEMAVWLPLYPFYFYSLAGQRVGNILVGASLAYLAAINYWNDFSAVVNIPEAAVAYAFSIVLGYVHESVHNSERRKLERIALLDNLTGAYNRHGLSSTWAGIHQHAVLTGSAISLVLFDIDHFKKINDVHGHDVGDRVLKKVVERVKMRLRASDYIVRWGGEEFALILPGADVSQAAKVAENLRKGIEGEPFDSVGTVTCSFGVCRADGDVDFEVAIKRADEALYSAKSLGRNRVETAPEPVNGNPVAVSV